MRRRLLVNNYDGYPVIYYTTSTGEKIDDSEFGLEILSHIQESNGVFKIICKTSTNGLPKDFLKGNTIIEFIRFENCEKLIMIEQGCLVTSSLVIGDFSGLNNVKSIGTEFLQWCLSCRELIFPNNTFTENLARAGEPSINTAYHITSLTLLGDEVHESLLKRFNPNNQFEMINSDLKIYVPHPLVEAYKERFPELADRIYCILREECDVHFCWPEVDYPAIMYVMDNDLQIPSVYLPNEATSTEKIGQCYVVKCSSNTITYQNNLFFCTLNGLTFKGNLLRIKFNDVKLNVFPTCLYHIYPNLIEADLSVVEDLTDIKQCLLNGCKSLQSIDLTPLKSINSITGTNIFSNMICQKDIDFSKLESLTSSSIVSASTALFQNCGLMNIDISSWPIRRIGTNSFKPNCGLMNLKINNVLLDVNINGTYIDLSYAEDFEAFEEFIRVNYPDYDGEVHAPYVWVCGDYKSSIVLPYIILPEGGHIILPHSEYQKYLEQCKDKVDKTENILFNGGPVTSLDHGSYYRIPSLAQCVINTHANCENINNYKLEIDGVSYTIISGKKNYSGSNYIILTDASNISSASNSTFMNYGGTIWVEIPIASSNKGIIMINASVYSKYNISANNIAITEIIETPFIDKLYCDDFPEGIANNNNIYTQDEGLDMYSETINISFNDIFKEQCDYYKVIAIINDELLSLLYHYKDGGYFIEEDQGIDFSFFAPDRGGIFFSFTFDDYRDITSLYIRCVEPVKSPIKWEVMSGTWNPSNNSDAIDGVKYTCVSPGTNGMTRIRCNFSGLKAITFTFKSDAESNYDYLIVGKLDADLGTAITSWVASSVYNNTNVTSYTRGKQGQWLTCTFNTIVNEDQHFVDFIFGKDSSNDTQPDNAQVYISYILE